jgi:hypothetical protein
VARETRAVAARHRLGRVVAERHHAADALASARLDVRLPGPWHASQPRVLELVARVHLVQHRACTVWSYFAVSPGFIAS